MERFNLKILQRFWAIAKPYWLGQEKWKALGLFAFLSTLLIVATRLFVRLNREGGNLVSSLADLDGERFWQTVWVYLGLLAIYVPLLTGYRYLREKLGLFWRKWLTNFYLERYFDRRSFFDLLDRPDIDNPDQRLSEDIRSFTQDSLFFVLVFVESLLQIIAFSIVLWNISHLLVYVLIVYSFLGNTITIGFLGKILVRLNFEQLKKEANFRFNLVRVRENAESIAFYRGEEREIDWAKSVFTDLYDNFNRLIFWREWGLGLIANPYQLAIYIIPAIAIGPSILAGELEVGKLQESSGAFLSIFFSLNQIVTKFENLTKFTAGIDRLYTFEMYLEQPRTERNNLPENATTIEIIEDSRLQVDRLTLQTPNYQRVLCRDLSLTVQPRQGVLVIGPSGCGKSSLLRAIAGLWNAGSGKITRPPLDEMLFLPQRPYTIMGTLREQLLYPRGDRDIRNEELQDVLQQVNLPDLDKRYGGFEAIENWSERLSLGEQQRISFARILLNRPNYVILDEATSALDTENEQRLYQKLSSLQTTFISVGHRPTLKQYHQWILELSENQEWTLAKLGEL
ncbi:MAG: ABC transporter ATP-binding protein/permease [Cyanobacteria bacterium P01_E01_bin.42]